MAAHCKVDVVLALSRAFMQKYGIKRLSHADIAMWGEAIDGRRMSRENIRLIERRALIKIRKFHNLFGREDLDHVCGAFSRSVEGYHCSFTHRVSNRGNGA